MTTIDPALLIVVLVVWAFLAGPAFFCLTLVALVSTNKHALEVLAKAFAAIVKRVK